MKIDVEIEVESYETAVRSYLADVVRPALAAGLNAAAELVRQDLVAQLQEDLEDPTPFTLKAFGVMPAVPREGEDVDAMIFVRDAQAEYLHFQIDGGVRRAGDYGTTKASALVPGPHAKVNKYGNLPQGYVTREDGRDDRRVGRQVEIELAQVRCARGLVLASLGGPDRWEYDLVVGPQVDGHVRVGRQAEAARLDKLIGAGEGQDGVHSTSLLILSIWVSRCLRWNLAMAS